VARRRSNKTRGFVQLDAKMLKNYMPIIGPNGLAVYTCLKLHENRRTGQCNPSYQTIANETGLSRRSVIRYARLLINLKLISPIPIWDSKGDRTSNQYNFTDPGRLDYGEGGAEPLQPGSATESPPPPEPVPISHHADDNLAPQHHEGNQIYITKEETPEKTAMLKQKTCTHPTELVIHLDKDINICNRCFGLLDDNGELVEEIPAEDIAAA
jgi:hypothetical protein